MTSAADFSRDVRSDSAFLERETKLRLRYTGGSYCWSIQRRYWFGWRNQTNFNAYPEAVAELDLARKVGVG